MTCPLLEQIRLLASDVFRIPLAEISEASTPDQVPSWDSLQHVNLVLALEQQFGVEFDPDEISQLVSIGSMAQILSRKLATPRIGRPDGHAN